MHFDGTVTLGTLLQIGTMVAMAVLAFNAVAARLSVFENILKTHAAALEKHALRLDEYDKKFLGVVSELQRLIGRTEISQFRHREGR